jgi:ubiquinone/menaquinone biosynthesis C-methylase UbiE
MDALTSQKWDRAAGRYDLFAAGAEKRWAAAKQEFFAPMRGKILFLAAGTGLDFQFFPPNQDIVAIDISPEMIERARPRAAAYQGRMELRLVDVHELDAEEAFDQVFTACTFCSVPDPVNGLRRLHRALKPGGELRMFEHTGSRWFPFSVMLHLMTPISRLSGPELNRPTVANVAKAGFTIREVDNLYLDIVKTITAVK